MAFGGLKGTLTGSAASITASNSIAGSVAVAVGDLIFAVSCQQTALTSTAATDNLGNIYTAQNAGTLSGAAVSGRAFWSLVTVAGTLTSIAIAATASANDWCGVAGVIEGPFDPSPLDTNPANITTDITSPFTCPATGTLAQASEVVMAWGATTNASNFSWSATSPNLLAIGASSALIVRVALGYQAVSATTTVSPEFTAGGNPTADVLGTCSFKGVAPPAPPPFPRPMRFYTRRF